MVVFVRTRADSTDGWGRTSDLLLMRETIYPLIYIGNRIARGLSKKKHPRLESNQHDLRLRRAACLRHTPGITPSDQGGTRTLTPWWHGFLRPACLPFHHLAMFRVHRAGVEPAQRLRPGYSRWGSPDAQPMRRLHLPIRCLFQNVTAAVFVFRVAVVRGLHRPRQARPGEVRGRARK